jgi:hypothetical protein
MVCSQSFCFYVKKVSGRSITACQIILALFSLSPLYLNVCTLLALRPIEPHPNFIFSVLQEGLYSIRKVAILAFLFRNLVTVASLSKILRFSRKKIRQMIFHLWHSVLQKLNSAFKLERGATQCSV